MPVDDFNTYSAPKMRDILDRLDASEEAVAALRAGGQGAGLGTGTISGVNGDQTITGSGTLFTTELAALDEIYVNGETLIVGSITNDEELEVSVAPAADFSDLQYSYKTP
jgi:hypothetical protein